MKDFETQFSDPAHGTHALAKLLWGKASRNEESDGPQWHPLLCHMLDVMHVADLLWDRLPQTSRDILNRPFGGDENGKSWMRLLVALHDAGKASPGFQQKWPGHVALHAGVSLPKTKGECHPHGISGTALLGNWLATPGFLPKVLPMRIARSLARAVASHHGEFARDKPTSDCNAEDVEDWIGTGDWQKAHAQLLAQITSNILSEPLPEWQGGAFVAPEYMVLLAGLTAVADWIGSDADVFAYSKPSVGLYEYSQLSKGRARQALENLGWLEASVRAPRPFADLFPFPPRSLQLATENVLTQLDAPCILIVESTMGDGKTEAALLVTESLAPRLGHRGFFIGLPTQATSNQMLGRVEKFLRRVGRGSINLHLVHGDAGLSEQYQRLRFAPIYGDEQNDERSSVRAEGWFTQRKRSLLADYAVGTIDQSLMSVLQTRHNFVRLFGLAGKTVILDEVHAYDTYTSELLTRLVSWLSVLGSTVVILSATLPKKRRMDLLAAYGATPIADEAPYPRISAGTRDFPAISQGTTASRPSQRLQLQHLEDDIEKTATDLIDAIEEGGCAAWICNTVARAQLVYTALSAQLAARGLDNGTSISLLHSRFLRKDRSRLEKLAEKQFGPADGESSARPRRAILVGTQVIEQSLDLDFDLMISDIAPIDLLLQRSGRLHRHERTRLTQHQEPRLWIINPRVDEASVPSFKDVARVYQEDVMIRTYSCLLSIQTIVVPDELESWVERVYGDEAALDDQKLQERLDAVSTELEIERQSDANKAARALLFSPESAVRTDKFGTAHSDLIEGEAGDVHATMRAQTRLGEPTADAVCLWKTDTGYSFDPAGEREASLIPSSSAMLRGLLEHSVKVDLWRLKKWQTFASQPAEWSTEASLQNRWLLTLGQESDAAGLRLDSDLGLICSSRG